MEGCEVVNYSPFWHAKLLEYMKGVFPDRDICYLEWWITNIDNSKECWNKCTIILNNDIIIGCTTVNEARLIVGADEMLYFCRGNTIVSPKLRGKGISKQIYNRINLYDNWFSFGITDIAWAIQPRYVKNFTPINPVNVYISLQD